MIWSCFAYKSYVIICSQNGTILKSTTFKGFLFLFPLGKTESTTKVPFEKMLQKQKKGAGFLPLLKSSVFMQLLA